MTWTSAEDTRTATLTRSSGVLDRPDRRPAEEVRIDRPQLDQQQRDRGHAGRDVDALGEPVAPDRARRLRQPGPRLVLVVAQQPGDEADRRSRCRAPGRSERSAPSTAAGC